MERAHAIYCCLAKFANGSKRYLYLKSKLTESLSQPTSIFLDCFGNIRVHIRIITCTYVDQSCSPHAFPAFLFNHLDVL